jgi:hypothetical protein
MRRTTRRDGTVAGSYARRRTSFRQCRPHETPRYRDEAQVGGLRHRRHSRPSRDIPPGLFPSRRRTSIGPFHVKHVAPVGNVGPGCLSRHVRESRRVCRWLTMDGSSRRRTEMRSSVGRGGVAHMRARTTTPATGSKRAHVSRHGCSAVLEGEHPEPRTTKSTRRRGSSGRTGATVAHGFRWTVATIGGRRRAGATGRGLHQPATTDGGERGGCAAGEPVVQPASAEPAASGVWVKSNGPGAHDRQ